MDNKNYQLVNSQDLTVVIPAKSLSRRCKNKNLRAFYSDQSLLEIKLRQINQYFPGSPIIIFTDNAETVRKIELISTKIGANTKALIGATSGNFSTDFHQIAKHVETKYMMRACVTTPFINGEDMRRMYVKLLELLEQDKFDSIMAVEKIQSHLVNHQGTPNNYHYGEKHIGSEALDPLFSVKAGVFILPTELAQKNKYHFGENPYLYIFDSLKSIDINEESDWVNCQELLHSEYFASRLGL